MRKIYATMMALLFVGTAIGQIGGNLGSGKGTGPIVEFNSNYTGTTMEEWLYATKGYQDDVSEGKDPEKKGYSFKDAYSINTKDGNTPVEINFVEMLMGGKLRAVIVKIKKGNAANYYALPIANTGSDVELEFYRQTANCDSTRRLLLLMAINEYHMNKKADK